MAKVGRFANVNELDAARICIFCNESSEFRTKNEYMDHLVKKHKQTDLYVLFDGRY